MVCVIVIYYVMIMIENDAGSIYSLFIEMLNTVYEEQSFVGYLNDVIDYFKHNETNI